MLRERRWGTFDSSSNGRVRGTRHAGTSRETEKILEDSLQYSYYVEHYEKVSSKITRFFFDSFHSFQVYREFFYKLLLKYLKEYLFVLSLDVL